jgi:hypothetical protein
MFQRRLEARGAAPPLPWDSSADEPPAQAQQLGLF